MDPEGETRASKRARKTSSRLISLGADDEGARFPTRRFANKRSRALAKVRAFVGAFPQCRAGPILEGAERLSLEGAGRTSSFETVGNL